MNSSQNIGELVEQLRRSTVYIGTEGEGGGSGVIADACGTIVTNAHVALHRGSTGRVRNLMVQTWDGCTFHGTLKNSDRTLDLATISVSTSGLLPASLGNSQKIRVGEIVVAVGNPFGFSGAATMGTVHAVAPVPRMGASLWVQSDLRLAPGNSGGPLANARGEIIGINTMIVDGLGMAIPSNIVRRFLEPASSRELLGVKARPVNLSIGGQACMGFLILEILEGSPAETASLLPGDILIGTDHGLFHSTEDLLEAPDGEGERVIRLKFLRGNNKQPRLTAVLLGAFRNKAA